jgi:hypothetical protein
VLLTLWLELQNARQGAEFALRVRHPGGAGGRPWTPAPQSLWLHFFQYYGFRPRAGDGSGPDGGLVLERRFRPQYLQAWIEGQDGPHPYLRRSEPARLRVTLGDSPEAWGRPGPPAPASAAAEPYYAVDYVDVVVLCPGADVEPIDRRLFLPPRPGEELVFVVTPRAGEVVTAPLRITVQLQVRNEPIHERVLEVDVY